MKKIIKTSRTAPEAIPSDEYGFDSFGDDRIFDGKLTGILPAMGWNSWNAFGSQNTEELTKIMADRMVDLGLDKLGYEYVVLDDGCYYPERVEGRLANEKIKFPSGFRSLADYIHSKGLKFGMYNDIGTNLCAGSAVGTCGFEDLDARSYVNWDVDFLKIDNCYYLWDNATFSNGENAKYSYAPNILSIKIAASDFKKEIKAEDALIVGEGVKLADSYLTGIGTFDGTNVGRSPVGIRSGEVHFIFDAPYDDEYSLILQYASGKEEGQGQWLQIAVENDTDKAKYYFDGLLPESVSSREFTWSDEFKIVLKKGKNTIRLMNHRRQENVLISYAAMFNALKEANADKEILLSICEWGKTQPHNWGYKIGNSWRILNDITFQVGSPGNPGKATWTDPGTPSITSQYDKAVIMDEYASLQKGWNDPDMLVIGMDGISLDMARSHMTMWCMMNSPLMLGMDLRRVEKGDDIYSIIANKDVIDLNQDKLGIQAKRVFCSLTDTNPDSTYITNHNRLDILAKPLANGDLAVSFFNLGEVAVEKPSISIDRILTLLGSKMTNKDDFSKAKCFKLTDLWTKEESILQGTNISIEKLEPYCNVTYRVAIK